MSDLMRDVVARLRKQIEGAGLSPVAINTDDLRSVCACAEDACELIASDKPSISGAAIARYENAKEALRRTVEGS